MALLLHQRDNHLELAAAGGRNADTKRSWPSWKRIMSMSVAALYRWHPEKMTAQAIVLDPHTGNPLIDPATGSVTTRSVSLTYSQSCAAWQAGFRIGFEAGAGYRKKRMSK